MSSNDLFQVRSRAVGTFHVSPVKKFVEIRVVFREGSVNDRLKHPRDVCVDITVKGRIKPRDPAASIFDILILGTLAGSELDRLGIYIYIYIQVT